MVIWRMGEFGRSFRLRRLHARLGQVVCELAKVRFSQSSGSEVWRPSMNIYRLADRIEILVDLAGVDKEEIDLLAEAGRLIIRGRRELPDPSKQQQGTQILAMEIDDGPFEREISLAPGVDPERITAEYRDGLLFISLPLRAHC